LHLAGKLLLTLGAIFPGLIGSLTLRPGCHRKSRDKDQDQDSAEGHLFYHQVSTPGYPGLEHICPVSPVSIRKSAGFIKLFLKLEAT
jgi:hypothetical protein